MAKGKKVRDPKTPKIRKSVQKNIPQKKHTEDSDLESVSSKNDEVSNSDIDSLRSSDLDELESRSSSENNGVDENAKPQSVTGSTHTYTSFESLPSSADKNSTRSRRSNAKSNQEHEKKKFPDLTEENLKKHNDQPSLSESNPGSSSTISSHTTQEENTTSSHDASLSQTGSQEEASPFANMDYATLIAGLVHAINALPTQDQSKSPHISEEAIENNLKTIFSEERINDVKNQSNPASKIKDIQKSELAELNAIGKKYKSSKDENKLTEQLINVAYDAKLNSVLNATPEKLDLNDGKFGLSTPSVAAEKPDDKTPDPKTTLGRSIETDHNGIVTIALAFMDKDGKNMPKDNAKYVMAKYGTDGELIDLILPPGIKVPEDGSKPVSIEVDGRTYYSKMSFGNIETLRNKLDENQQKYTKALDWARSQGDNEDLKETADELPDRLGSYHPDRMNMTELLERYKDRRGPGLGGDGPGDKDYKNLERRFEKFKEISLKNGPDVNNSTGKSFEELEQEFKKFKERSLKHSPEVDHSTTKTFEELEQEFKKFKERSLKNGPDVDHSRTKTFEELEQEFKKFKERSLKHSPKVDHSTTKTFEELEQEFKKFKEETLKNGPEVDRSTSKSFEESEQEFKKFKERSLKNGPDVDHSRTKTFEELEQEFKKFKEETLKNGPDVDRSTSKSFEELEQEFKKFKERSLKNGPEVNSTTVKSVDAKDLHRAVVPTRKTPTPLPLPHQTSAIPTTFKEVDNSKNPTRSREDRNNNKLNDWQTKSLHIQENGQAILKKVANTLREKDEQFKRKPKEEDRKELRDDDFRSGDIGKELNTLSEAKLAKKRKGGLKSKKIIEEATNLLYEGKTNPELEAMEDKDFRNDTSTALNQNNDAGKRVRESSNDDFFSGNEANFDKFLNKMAEVSPVNGAIELPSDKEDIDLDTEELKTLGEKNQELKQKNENLDKNINDFFNQLKGDLYSAIGTKEEPWDGLERSVQESDSKEDTINDKLTKLRQLEADSKEITNELDRTIDILRKGTQDSAKQKSAKGGGQQQPTAYVNRAAQNLANRLNDDKITVAYTLRKSQDGNNFNSIVPGNTPAHQNKERENKGPSR